ncbi:NACHT domain-containing protein [Amycolatopsis sp. NPDC004625]|uniref:NACHT domain-containing protein n=1 Tax=Amycolatopsis sp. NPDC004625 TaxID=3154670 RepID=UPI0033A8FF80
MADDQGTGNRIVGNVHAAVQAGAILGDVHFHGSAPVAEPEITPPRGWDDRPELPPAVRHLLKAQIETAKDLPYQLPGARQTSLAAVYVRQEISSETDSGPSEPARPRPVLDGRGQRIDLPTRPVPRLVVRPPSRTVRAALDDDDHLLVTGGPGQGKSTLSLRLAADIAAQWKGHDGEAPLAEPVVPLRLPARELATRLTVPFFQALAESIEAEYGALLDFSIEAATLARRVAGCRWLLLVDGLDEVADLVQRDRLIKVLAARASQEASAHFRIVLTTRPIAGAALAPFHGAGAARYELLPFDEEALRHFAANWFAEGDMAERFVRQVHDANLDELVRVPLLATIAAIMFEQDTDRRLPDNRYELYESYLAYLQSARSIPPSPWDECRSRLFEHLGCVRLEEDTSLLTAACEWTAAEVPHACATPNWRDRLTTYLTAVGPFVSRAGELRFLHHSFAEHLAATAHALRLPDSFDPTAEDFVRLLHTARPGERGRHARLVLLHYTRLRQPETDRLIEHLHAGNPAMHVLAARLLAWHAPASAEVADAFLATARKWAMTTQYPAQVILTQVSRAAHHPALAGWLRDLMGDPEAPWESRIEAGRALAARLYGADRVDAVAMLRSVVEDETIAVEFRFEAAKALAECGAAERVTAVTGLRSVLADPAASALQCRNAAIVLAGLGQEPRARAIEALVALLDDPQVPEEDMVHAATGLLEIGAGYEERCADLFRAVLARREGATLHLWDAAVGLASLGPDHLAETVAMLKAQLAGQRPNGLRLTAARILADLGPEHRLAAGELLTALASRPGTGPSFRVNIAGVLGKIGPEFHDRALAMLRAVAANRSAGTNALLWTADNFADLGPEHHAEAAGELTRVVGHPHAEHFERTLALGKLADLGEPHRAAAVLVLRGDLTDRGAQPELRLDAGRELIRLGPEFHPEAARHLLEIASARRIDPQLRMSAWQALRLLGTVRHHQASDAILDLLSPREADAWETHSSIGVLHDDDIDARAAAPLGAILRDPARGVRHRVAAARSLVNLGRHYHPLAVSGFVELLGRNEIPVDELSQAVGAFAEVSAARRAELAQVLTAAVVPGPASAESICATAEALAGLDVSDSRMDAAMHALLSDESITGRRRFEAAMIVARKNRATLPAALDAVRRLRHDIGISAWVSHARELVALGEDLAGELRTGMSAANAELWLRQYCTKLLGEYGPGPSSEASAELRAQIEDDLIPFSWRSRAALQLIELDPDTLDEAIIFHRRALDDEGELVSHRCEAANTLVQLDPAQHIAAMAVLRRLAGSSELYGAERSVALNRLNWSNPPPAELVPLARAIVHDPAASATVRQNIASLLPAAEFRAVSRATIADRFSLVDSWTATTSGYWDNWSVASELEATLRDTLAAPETPARERIAAATALGGLSPRLLPEAIALLSELGGSGHLRRQRLLALAELDPSWRRRLLADARATLDGAGWRPRVEAADFLIDLDPEPLTAADRVRLTRLLHDPRLADQPRIALFAALEQLDDIRALRDDPRSNPATRWLAANWMRDYTREDRERGARILATIAGDPASRPALRWRTARALALFGARGRTLAVERLRAMMTDEALPVLARVNSARVLGDVRPDLRGEALALLRRLQATACPAVRFQVLETVGRYEPEEAALALRAMAEDTALDPLVRLQCADRLATVHRDYREPAALVCRELARDESVPLHIRVDAARGLALLSVLCRQEARELLTEIRASQPSRASAAAQSDVPEGS